VFQRIVGPAGSYSSNPSPSMELLNRAGQNPICALCINLTAAHLDIIQARK
jgi:hypothetical protein